MTRRVSILLLAAAGWTLFIWVTRLVNMAGEDRSVGFYVVHGALAVISIAFGLPSASWAGGRCERDRRVQGPIRPTTGR